MICIRHLCFQYYFKIISVYSRSLKTFQIYLILLIIQKVKNLILNNLIIILVIQVFLVLVIFPKFYHIRIFNYKLTQFSFYQGSYKRSDKYIFFYFITLILFVFYLFRIISLLFYDVNFMGIIVFKIDNYS